MDERVLNYNVRDGPFALGRVTQVPNQRKNVHEYVVEYESIYDNTDRWITHFPKTFFVQECLKDAVTRVNQMNWSMSVKKKNKKIRNRQKQAINSSSNKGKSMTAMTAVQNQSGTTALAGIFEESHLPQHVPIKQPPHLKLHHIALPYKQDLLLMTVTLKL